jgi:hypothetical protein
MMEYGYFRVKDINLQMEQLSQTELNYVTQLVICMSSSVSADPRLDAGPLIQYLQKVKSWLDANADQGIPTYH